jgi:hypothetical protein
MAKLRSGEWYAGDARNAYLHRAWMRQSSSCSGTSSCSRGERLYADHVQQADTGADLGFLVGASGLGVARESH